MPELHVMITVTCPRQILRTRTDPTLSEWVTCGMFCNWQNKICSLKLVGSKAKIKITNKNKNKKTREEFNNMTNNFPNTNYTLELLLIHWGNQSLNLLPSRCSLFPFSNFPCICLLDCFLFPSYMENVNRIQISQSLLATDDLKYLFHLI